MGIISMEQKWLKGEIKTINAASSRINSLLSRTSKQAEIISEIEETIDTVQLEAVLDKTGEILSAELKRVLPGSLLRVYVQKTQRSPTCMTNMYLRFRRSKEFPTTEDIAQLALLNDDIHLARIVRTVLVMNATAKSWKYTVINFEEIKSQLELLASVK